MIPITNKGYRLLHEGCIALSQVEANGMKIDTKYLHKAITQTGQKIDDIILQMKEDKIFKIWRREFGRKTNIGSGEQLGKILFSVMDYPCLARTKTGRPKVDETAFASVDLDFVRDFVKLGKLKKARSTYLQGILRETTNGFLHPFFNLNIPRTYRGSSNHPNFQNIPVRNPEIAKLVRRAFIPRINHQIVEIDYSGVEICNATCYHKDPRMISYIKDKRKDLHRDAAMQVYKLSKKELTPKDKNDKKEVKRAKDIRYCGKNMFIFPEFYGDYYIHCAKNLWEAIGQMNLKRRDGYDLYSHLETEGIYELGDCNPDKSPKEGTFEKHLQEVEDDFWNKRFRVYGQWKKDWYYAYLKKGYFDTLTGFRIEGLYGRNEVLNYPVQGSAFHWLLWSLIRIQKLLNKYKMRTLIVGQIHDSIVSDVYKKELRNYLEICKQVMTIDICKHWKWINVPLTVEAEVAPLNKSWYEKKEYKL